LFVPFFRSFHFSPYRTYFYRFWSWLKSTKTKPQNKTKKAPENPRKRALKLKTAKRKNTALAERKKSPEKRSGRATRKLKCCPQCGRQKMKTENFKPLKARSEQEPLKTKNVLPQKRKKAPEKIRLHKVQNKKSPEPPKAEKEKKPRKNCSNFGTKRQNKSQDCDPKP